MKVLKENHGNVFPMEIECKYVADQYGFGNGNPPDFCHSILEVEESDIKKHPWFKYPDYEGTDYGVICPVCGNFVAIDEKKLPKLVKEKAEKISLGRG